MSDIQQTGPARNRVVMTTLVGLLLLLLGTVWFGLLYVTLPATRDVAPTPHGLLLIVVASAGLGSMIHAATSFASHVGNGNLNFTWAWWYLLRTPIGIALALLSYAALRAGKVVAGGNADDAYTVLFFSGTAGMFSKQAIDRRRRRRSSRLPVSDSRPEPE